MAAAIGSPSRAAPSRAASAPSHAALRVASPASSASAGHRRGAVAVAAMQPAKAVAAAEAPVTAAMNGAAVAGMARPDSMGRFGRFGGKYVPETLMHALTELEAAFHALATDDEFKVTSRNRLLL